jgi:hypothetical protein
MHDPRDIPILHAAILTETLELAQEDPEAHG